MQRRFILKNLSDLLNDNNYLNMSYGDCIKLLLNEAVIAGSANDRCRAAIAWLDYDSLGRGAHVTDILNAVPFAPGLMSIDVLLEADECETLWEHAPNTMRKVMACAIKRMKTSHPALGTASVGGNGYCAPYKNWYVVGGSVQNGRTSLFLKFDAGRRSWLHLPALPWTREMSGACAVGDHLIIMGGYKDDKLSADIDEYDLFKSTWSTSTAKLGTAYGCVAACSIGSYAYAFNGTVESTERYCYDSKNVVKLSDRRSKQYIPAMASHNENIFIAGGLSGGDPTTDEIAGIKKYDTFADKWSKVGEMSQARYALAAAVSGEDLYLMGGVGGEDVVDIFNVRNGRIRHGQKLLKPRDDCNATTMCDGTVVLGGIYDRTVETFDVREGKWSTSVIVPDMPESMNFFGFASA